MSGTQAISPQEVNIIQDKSDDDDDGIIDVDWSCGSASLWQTPKHPALKLTQQTFQADTGTEEIPYQEEMSYESDDGIINADWTSGSTNLTPHRGTPSLHLPSPTVVKAKSNTTQKDPEDEDKIENNMVNDNAKRKWQSRRRPVLNKRKTVSSAGAKFELAAEKKMELIKCQTLLAETQLKQCQQEYEVKMEILQLQKKKESLKCQMLEQGKLLFEF